MTRSTLAAFVVSVSLVASGAVAGTASYFVPVATQVKGNTQYRTSVLVSNYSTTPATGVQLRFRYRSPVDGTFQTSTMLTAQPLGPRQSQYFEDIVATLNTVRAIRDADANQQLFGTLEVTFSSQNPADDNVFGDVVARTYSPAAGGLVGTAYKGSSDGGATAINTTVRHDTGLGTMENRTNIGFINRGPSLTDITLTYYDASTGNAVASFPLSSRANHYMAPGEVVQINDIFSDPTLVGFRNRSLVLRATSMEPIDGYVVQLDATTNDGSFYTMTPERAPADDDPIGIQ